MVDVVTGEEEESNVLQANVKLYIFESEKKNWVERGRGSLRLNDDPSSTPGHLRSRLVMRTVGTLRIVLNTKLFPNMKCEKVTRFISDRLLSSKTISGEREECPDLRPGGERNQSVPHFCLPQRRREDLQSPRVQV